MLFVHQWSKYLRNLHARWHLVCAYVYIYKINKKFVELGYPTRDTKLPTLFDKCLLPFAIIRVWLREYIKFRSFHWEKEKEKEKENATI